MKKLIFTACLLFTFGSVFAAEVGENDTDCAEMIQANRGAEASVVSDREEASEEASETASER